MRITDGKKTVDVKVYANLEDEGRYEYSHDLIGVSRREYVDEADAYRVDDVDELIRSIKSDIATNPDFEGDELTVEEEEE